jgi:ATP-dependent DNA helicase RecQ
VYLTPELAASPAGLERIARLHRDVGVSMLGVDEAHCISEWGRDFRPDFCRLAAVRRALPGVPVVAATATATPRVRREIARLLELGPDAVTVSTSFERPNLRFEARRRGNASSTAAEVAAICLDAGPTVVYVLTTRLADEFAEALTAALGRLAKSPKSSSNNNAPLGAASYHAKLDPSRRTEVHEAFLSDAPWARAVVATLAYGMGIDKPNVRAVVHVGAPASLEAYYQQAGRAGRDGLPARCVLLWAPGDVATADLVRGQPSSSLTSVAAAGQGTTDVQAFLSSPTCLAARLVNHFAGSEDHLRLPPEGPCRGTCDRCAVVASGDSNGTKADHGAPAKALLLAIRALNCRFGLGRAVSLLLPSFAASSANTKSKKTTTANPAWLVARAEQFGLQDALSSLSPALSHRPEGWWRALAGALVASGHVEYLSVPNGAGGSLSAPRLTALGAALSASDAPTLMVAPTAEMVAAVSSSHHHHHHRSSSTPQSVPVVIPEYDEALYRRLASWRSATASASGKPAYTVFPNKTLEAIALARPADLRALLACHGVGAAKCEQYGEAIVALCKRE